MAPSEHLFKYAKVHRRYRPIIPIRLRYNGLVVKYVGLVDSGADYNLFHAEIAQALGIDLTHAKKEPIGGFAGRGWAYPYTLDLGVENTFARATVLFSPDVSLHSFGILGQVGFFDRFAIEFLYNNKQIVLR